MADQASSPAPGRGGATSRIGNLEPFENEDEILGDQTIRDEDEEDGEELFGDNMENDYRPMPELDQYDLEMLDDNDDFSEMRRRDGSKGVHRDERDLAFDQTCEIKCIRGRSIPTETP